MNDARRYIELPAPFILQRGGRLDAVTMAYELWGTPNSDGSNVLLLFTGLSPSAHAASSVSDPQPGWWEAVIGPGRAIDTHRFCVLCINSLGSCFGSTGPASIDPATGAPYAIDFPHVTVEDIVKAGRETCRALGFEHVHTVAGCSLGGMDVIAYALLYPGTYRDLISISGAARATPFAIGLRALQRDIICSDPAWAGGHYDVDNGPRDGMRLARKLGMMTYRSGEEWRQRFAREPLDTASADAAPPFAAGYAIEGYLDHNAQRFVDRFDANCYLYLSRAMDWFDAADHGGSLTAASARIDARRALVAGATTDWLFPIDQQREVADLLRDSGATVTLHELDSLQGHDSFLIDTERFAPVIADFLANGPE